MLLNECYFSLVNLNKKGYPINFSNINRCVNNFLNQQQPPAPDLVSFAG